MRYGLRWKWNYVGHDLPCVLTKLAPSKLNTTCRQWSFANASRWRCQRCDGIVKVLATKSKQLANSLWCHACLHVQLIVDKGCTSTDGDILVLCAVLGSDVISGLKSWTVWKFCGWLGARGLNYTCRVFFSYHGTRVYLHTPYLNMCLHTCVFIHVESVFTW